MTESSADHPEASSWVDVGAESDFSEGEITPFVINGLEIILVKTSVGFYCCRDECGHQPVKLSDFGEVHGSRLLCHAHGAQFDLADGGRPLCFPANDGLTQLNHRINQGRVEVKIP